MTLVRPEPFPVIVPVTTTLPSTFKFSLILICELSSDVIVVPLTEILSILTPPVPLPVISTDAFVIIDVIASPLTCMLSTSTTPVPLG